MPNRRRAKLLAAVCSASLVAVSSAQAETLVAALTEAYSSNPTLRTARITQRQNDEAYFQQLVTQLDPSSLTLNLGQQAVLDGNSRTSIVASPTFSGLSLSQNISTGGNINRALTRNEIQLFQRRDALRQAEQTAMRTVITDYINVLSQELQIQISRAQLTTAQRNLDNFQAQFDVGTEIRSNVETARVALLRAQGQLQSTQNSLATAKAQYAIDVGHVPDDNIEAPPDLPNVPTSYEQALALAKQWGPTWRNAVYTDRLAELNLADAKVLPLPTARATVGYSLGTGEIRTGALNDLANKDQLTAGLSVSIPLYSFGLNSSRLRVARETRESASIALENADKTLTQNIQNQWNALVNARSQVEISTAGLQAQTLSTIGQRAQYQIGGQLTTTQLLQAEESLRTSQQSVITSLTGLYSAEANLLSTIGLLDPRYLIPNVTPFDPLANFEAIKSKFVIVPYAPAVTAVDSLFSPKLPAPKPGAELPNNKVDAATVVPPLTTMAPAPDPATAKQYVLPAVPDAPPPPPPMIPIPALTPVDTTGLQNQGPPGGRGGGAPGGGGFGGGGGGRGG